MGFITDLLAGVPINAVLKNKLEELEREMEVLRGENKLLKEKLATLSPTNCLRCRTEELVFFEERSSPMFGDDFGVKDRIYRCPSCGFEDARTHDPMASK